MRTWPARELLTSQSVDASTTTSTDAKREVRELCFGGDWACADGNLGTLGFVARQLSEYAAEPLQTKFLVLAELCREGPDHAIAVWLHLKDELLGRRQYLPS